MHSATSWAEQLLCNDVIGPSGGDGASAANGDSAAGAQFKSTAACDDSPLATEATQIAKGRDVKNKNKHAKKDNDTEATPRGRRKTWPLLRWWIGVASGVLALVATTTAASIVLSASNALRFQGFVVRHVRKHLEFQTNSQLQFSDSVVVLWKKRRIRVSDVRALRNDSSKPDASFDLSAESVDVKLSLLHWIVGKGLISEIDCTGVKGIIDRRREEELETTEIRKSRKGFNLSQFRMRDVSVTLYLPAPYTRPFSVGLFEIQCDILRQNWLVLDLLMCRSAAGQFDGSLFTLFRRPSKQLHKKETDLHMTNLKAQLLSYRAAPPIAWICHGTVDLCANISTVHPSRYDKLKLKRKEKPQVLMHFDTNFKHVRLQETSIPDPNLSIIANTMARVIVPYVNKHSESIPLSFDVNLPFENFDGSSSLSECGFWAALEESFTNAFYSLVAEHKQPQKLGGHLLQLAKDYLPSSTSEQNV
ncbi:inner membrane protein Mdm31 [Pelomyxa schiedti]|nr:inner membrane protein Mdm31 [Pelomyxa schiedti]